MSDREPGPIERTVQTLGSRDILVNTASAIGLAGTEVFRLGLPPARVKPKLS